MENEWRPIAGYDGYYEVSRDGLVRSLDRVVPNTSKSTRLLKGQTIAPHVRPNGYRTVKLALGRVKTSHYVHRLVAAAFHGPGGAGQEVCHRNGDKGCNRADNLYWGTRRENMADRERLGEAAKGERHGHAKLTGEQVIAIRRDLRFYHIIAADYGVSRSLVGMIKNGKIWSHL